MSFEKEIFLNVSQFLKHPTKKVLLLVGNIENPSQSLLQQSEQEKFSTFYMDLSKPFEFEKLSVHDVIIFDNWGGSGELENLYVKYQLDRFATKVIFICREAFLHHTLDPSIYFAPMKGGRVQRQLLSKLILPVSKPNERAVKKVSPVCAQTSSNKSSIFWHQKLMTQDTVMMQMLADNVIADENFKSYLFKVVYSSRDDDQMQVAAANAITALNYARISFSGMDLSGVKISGADLSQAICDGTDFSNADLTNLNLSDAWLRTAIFEQCSMRGVEFGQLPYLAHKGKVANFAISPDAKLLAAVLGDDPNVYVWDWRVGKFLYILKGGRLTRNATSKDLSSAIQFSKDCKLLAVGGQQRFVSVWNLITKELYDIAGMQGHAAEVKFSQNSEILAIGSSGIQLFNIKNKNKLHSCKQDYEQTSCFEFSADEKFIIAGSYDKKIRVWDITTGKCLCVYSGHKGGIRNIFINNKSSIIVSVSFEGEIGIWQENNPTSLYFISPPENKKYRFFHSIDNTEKIITVDDRGVVEVFDLTHKKVSLRFDTYISASHITIYSAHLILVTADHGNDIRLWDLNSGALLKVYRGHSDSISALQISDDGNFLYSSSFDKTIRIWNLDKSRRKTISYQNHIDGVFCLEKSKNCTVIASGDYWGNIILSQSLSGDCIGVLKGHSQLVTALTFSSDGKFLASGASTIVEKASTRIWDVTTRQCIKILMHVEGQSLFNGMHFTNENNLVYVSGLDVCIWDSKKDEVVRFEERGHTARISNSCVYYSENQMLIATCSFDKTVCLWDVNSKKLVKKFTGPKEKISSIEFSNKGDMLVAGCHDSEVWLWEIESGHCLHVFRKHVGTIFTIKFSFNDLYIAVGDLSGGVRIWNVLTRVSWAIKRNLNQVMTVQFSPDNRLLACGGKSNEIILCDLETQNIVAILKGYSREIHCLTFLDKNSFVTGSADHSLKCWRRITVADADYWQLQWNNSNENTLYTENVRIAKTILQRRDISLLMQYGMQDQTMDGQEVHNDSIRDSLDEKNLNQKIQSSREFNQNGARCFGEKNYFEAVKFFKQALSIAEEIYGDHHVDVAAICYNISKAYKSDDELSAALEYGERTVSIDRVIYSEINVVQAKHLMNSGEICQQRGDRSRSVSEMYNDYFHSKAVEYYTLALGMFKLCQGDNQQVISEIEKNIQYCITCQEVGENNNKKMGFKR